MYFFVKPQKTCNAETRIFLERGGNSLWGKSTRIRRSLNRSTTQPQGGRGTGGNAWTDVIPRMMGAPLFTLVFCKLGLGSFRWISCVLQVENSCAKRRPFQITALICIRKTKDKKLRCTKKYVPPHSIMQWHEYWVGAFGAWCGGVWHMVRI